MVKIIRPAELAKQLSISKVSLWRMEKQGKLPPRVRISRRAVGWRSSDIDQWLEELQTAESSK